MDNKFIHLLGMAKIRAIMDLVEEIVVRENIIDSETLVQKVYATGYRGSTTNIMIAYCLVKKKYANIIPITLEKGFVT